ncbi:MAG: hypothetical protein ACLSX3_04885, partial [Eggerthella lenta]
LLAARCSLLAARCSLLAARCLSPSLSHKSSALCAAKSSFWQSCLILKRHGQNATCGFFR